MKIYDFIKAAEKFKVIIKWFDPIGRVFWDVSFVKDTCNNINVYFDKGLSSEIRWLVIPETANMSKDLNDYLSYVFQMNRK